MGVRKEKFLARISLRREGQQDLDLIPVVDSIEWARFESCDAYRRQRMASRSVPFSSPDPMNYRIIRADRAAVSCQVGDIVFKVPDAFGLAFDDSDTTGVEHICVKFEAGKPFFTIPLEDLEPL